MLVTSLALAGLVLPLWCVICMAVVGISSPDCEDQGLLLMFINVC